MTEQSASQRAHVCCMEPLEQRTLLSLGAWGQSYEGPPLANIDGDFVRAPDPDAFFSALAIGDVQNLADQIAALKAGDPGADARTFGGAGAPQVTADGRILANVQVVAATQDTLTALTASGLEVKYYWTDAGKMVAASDGREIGADSTTRNRVHGWVAYDKVASLAETDGVKRLELVLGAVTNVGAFTTAGDGILNADDLRTALGVDGTAVSIGVISDDIDNWTEARETGDLPSTIHYDPDFLWDNHVADEGTAMLEIAHDIAPGADLYFASGMTNMAGAIGWLVNQGVDIIVDDLSVFTEPYLQDGAIAGAAADAIGAGITYISAAGNAAQHHYQGDFDQDVYGFHQFPTGNILPVVFYGDATETTTLGVAVQWSDEWGNSDNDYALHAFRWTGSQWVYITSSDAAQAGEGDPLEWLSLTNTTHQNLLYGFVIELVDGDARELELYTWGTGDFLWEDNIVASDSVFGHQAVPGAITVAAIDADDEYEQWDEVEPFSSQGPSRIYTDFSQQTYTERNSLDVAGIDGVETSIGDKGYFPQPFFGTSAAAPHIAAIAALLKEINPNLTPGEIQDLITGSAVDIQAQGYDHLSGDGRADALAIISAAPSSVDLVAASDTGVSSTDDITKLDNIAVGKALTFDVLGTVAGARVTLYGGEVEIGSATATGSTTTVTTDGECD